MIFKFVKIGVNYNEKIESDELIFGDELGLLVDPRLDVLVTNQHKDDILIAPFAIGTHGGYDTLYHISSENIELYGLGKHLNDIATVGYIDPKLKEAMKEGAGPLKGWHTPLPLSPKLIEETTILKISIDLLIKMYGILHIHKLDINISNNNGIIVEVLRLIRMRMVKIDKIVTDGLSEQNQHQLMEFYKFHTCDNRMIFQ